MNFITPVVRHTMDNNMLAEFGQLKCVISVNIMDFAFSPWIFAEMKPKLRLLRSVDTENVNI